ncbi:uncharacterized protein LOC120389102 [Mauremys reevesii]|uniref:uncharacterized protein LOC120389102 n=1 Tax=Mauremys reevesii TaxID=260615 RepID=UPI00193FBA21|nr:uncharacterized protein LOC120389102 [Mauremys reevesii]
MEPPDTYRNSLPSLWSRVLPSAPQIPSSEAGALSLTPTPHPPFPGLHPLPFPLCPGRAHPAPYDAERPLCQGHSPSPTGAWKAPLLRRWEWDRGSGLASPPALYCPLGPSMGSLGVKGIGTSFPTIFQALGSGTASQMGASCTGAMSGGSGDRSPRPSKASNAGSQRGLDGRPHSLMEGLPRDVLEPGLLRAFLAGDSSPSSMKRASGSLGRQFHFPQQGKRTHQLPESQLFDFLPLSSEVSPAPSPHLSASECQSHHYGNSLVLESAGDGLWERMAGGVIQKGQQGAVMRAGNRLYSSTATEWYRDPGQVTLPSGASLSLSLK